MNYGQIRKYDIANGTGIRTSIFVTGCTHKCFNCFNEEYQDPHAGKVWTEAETKEVLSYVQDENVTGLTLLGGEPFQNVEGLLPVVKAVRKAAPDKDVWAYSGYTFDQLLACPEKKALLEQCDILVDGRFMDDLKDPALRFRGSANQRIIDVKASLAKSDVVIAMS